jgi:small subunit ribosomal protein S11
MAQTAGSTRRKGAKKVKRSLSSGQIHISATFNNTIITVTDLDGNTVAWSSAGATGFKGSRKSTPFAARLAAESAVKAAQG